MKSLITFALEYRFLVIVLTLLVAVVGLFSLHRLPIDAVPDITPNQVLVLTQLRVYPRLKSSNTSHFPSKPR